MVTPTRVPLALQLVMALALMFALNRVWPEILPAMLLLVALYLVLTHQAAVGALLTGGVERFGATFGAESTASNGGGGGHRAT